MCAYRVSCIADVVTDKLACPWSLRAPEEIWADLRALEAEAEGLLGELGVGQIEFRLCLTLRYTALPLPQLLRKESAMIDGQPALKPGN